jgi:drug/metabolite transporter (DMT)-like permease
MNNTPQSYANHRRRIPPLYLFGGFLIVVAAGLLGWQVARTPNLSSIAALVLAVGCGVSWFWIRAGDMTVQDRVIRAEMHARLERVLGASRRLDIARLTLRQLIGLRFASDAELPALVAEVLSGATTGEDAIKRKVRDWQADHQRV